MHFDARFRQNKKNNQMENKENHGLNIGQWKSRKLKLKVFNRISSASLKVLGSIMFEMRKNILFYPRKFLSKVLHEVNINKRKSKQANPRKEIQT